MNVANPRASATRQRILDIAARQFRERGYAGVSLRSIAFEAGMKAGSLYYHFASREEIVTEVLDVGIELVHDSVARVLDEAGEDTPPEHVLQAAMARHLRAFLTFSDYTSANVRIFGQVPESVRQANLPARRRYEGLWDEILEWLRRAGALRRDVDLQALRLFLLGAMNSTLEWFDPRRGNIESIAESYAGFVLHGVLDSSGNGR